MSPMAYIMERFRHGLDREISKLKTLTLTDEEREWMGDIGSVVDVVGRQQRGKTLWYEVKKTGRKGLDTQWYPITDIEKLFKPYVKKLMQNFDEKQKAIDSGMALRPNTAAEILEHLADFGIDQALAHGKIRQMSGGQRQRLVICAAFCMLRSGSNPRRAARPLLILCCAAARTRDAHQGRAAYAAQWLEPAT